jgi:hypothetical protein
VPETLKKTFKARIILKEEKYAKLKADPLIEIRSLLEEM